ncbi:MAG: hypothetical protein JNL11_10220 [Bdellovibrionaceae bacterium]|nr:hypothetical protein [Pseudobdellovibrionaceae bacterium]
MKTDTYKVAIFVPDSALGLEHEEQKLLSQTLKASDTVKVARQLNRQHPLIMTRHRYTTLKKLVLVKFVAV